MATKRKAILTSAQLRQKYARVVSVPKTPPSAHAADRPDVRPLAIGQHLHVIEQGWNLGAKAGSTSARFRPEREAPSRYIRRLMRTSRKQSLQRRPPGPSSPPNPRNPPNPRRKRRGKPTRGAAAEGPAAGPAEARGGKDIGAPEASPRVGGRRRGAAMRMLQTELAAGGLLVPSLALAQQTTAQTTPPVDSPSEIVQLQESCGAFQVVGCASELLTVSRST